MKQFFAAMLSGILLSAYGQETRPMSFQEVFSLIRTNLPDLSEEELSRLAAVGLIKELGTKVQLITNNASASAPSEDVIGRRSIYNDAYGYLQIRSVNDRLPTEFKKWAEQAASTNSTRGLVVDLRYSQGDDYEAAAKVADLFAKPGEPLLKLGTNVVRSTEKTKIIELPLAILANNETRGAAEALAALLREVGTGLLIGSTTAGEARLFEVFTLSTGQKLKIGTVPVQVDDQKAIPSKGLPPDIAVSVNPATEKFLYLDPYGTGTAAQRPGAATNEVAASTNRSRRFNEAELVRRHRSGGNIDDPNIALPAGAEPPDQPVINDPALARALDFLKGISALQRRPQ